MLYLKINSSYVSPPPSNWEVTVIKQWTSTFSWWFISPTKNLVKKNKDFLSLFLGKKWPNSKERTKQTRANETFLLMYISCCYWSLAIKTEPVGVWTRGPVYVQNLLRFSGSTRWPCDEERGPWSERRLDDEELSTRAHVYSLRVMTSISFNINSNISFWL